MSEQNTLLQKIDRILHKAIGDDEGVISAHIVAVVKQHYEEDEPDWVGARHLNLENEQKGLDRPELREKIERLEINFCFALLAFDAGHIHKDEMDLHRDYLIDQILALIPDIPDPAKLKEIASQCLVEAKQELADEAKRIEEAKKQERERIACEMEETIYNQVRHLQTKIDEHPWSRQQTNYDSKFIGYIDKSLLQIGNALYSFRQALKEEKEETYDRKDSS